MKRNLAYLYYLLTHKYYVYLAGRKLGMGKLQLLMHDLSKFNKDEWGPYAHRFYGADGKPQVLDPAPAWWTRAWFLHQRRNPHHWQFWVVANPELERYEMPEDYVKEMVADWAGCGKAKTGSWDLMDWATENIPRMQLHAGTESRAWELIAQLRDEL